MIKACLFDLDGVVFDTEPLYTIYWGQIGRKYHPEIEGFEYKIKGQTLVQIYEKYFPGEDAVQTEITKGLDEYEKNMSYIYVDGFEKFVRELKKQGIKTAIVTSSNLAKMEIVYHHHPELKSYFDHIFTSEDFKASKPDPDCYLTGAAAFGYKPSECVVFEDSFNGLKSGLAAGARVIGLSTTNSEASIREYTQEVIPNFIGFSLNQ
ncbi:HAD family phosphatase [Prevotella sp. HUN102]|uniref:HAD family hydrolase n=1 Tax=Prevotella sp. HUN102 TaxID=1392486 RepID=UPI00048CFD7F|nr:HAD family phosphatase [Prevotella sp. HUN102]